MALRDDPDSLRTILKYCVGGRLELQGVIGRRDKLLSLPIYDLDFFQWRHGTLLRLLDL
jgi:hypothetical protein